jgi:ferredoxin/DMSO/TMAO reductase YedYZ heme-binding membrane subunit
MYTASDHLHVLLAGMGFVALSLLWLSILSGYALRRSWSHTWIRRPTLETIHHSLALTGLCIGALHGLGQLATPNGTLAVAATVVPFIDVDDPIGIGVAVIGLELLLGVAASVMLQHRLGYARWRGVHLLAYTAFALIVTHVLISGSDVASLPVWLAILAGALVTVALWATTTPGIGRTWQILLGGLRRNDASTVTVRVDTQLCAQFGYCEHAAPQFFRVGDGDGRISYQSSIPVTSAEAVMRAMEACPTKAISMLDRTGRVWSPSTQPPTDNRAAPAVPGTQRPRPISR